MIAFNLSMDSKVWAEEYDLQGRVTKPRDRRSAKYDNLPGKVYFDKPYDLFKAVRKTPKGKAEKVKCGTRVVRFEQTQKGILPFVLDQLLRARQETKKKAERETDESMKDNYDKRQLAYKVTANSLYGQCGARTSTFYDKDVAACCTAYGRELIMCVMDCVRVYTHTPVETKAEGLVVATVEPIYGDTDSVFIKFTVEKDGTRLPGKRALPVTMELAKGVAAMITKCLSHPHELEYEKIYFPFILQNKKKYDGFMYENDPNSGKLKSMGNVLKRRDIPPIVKDIYGGLIDCIMDGKSILEGILFLKDEVRKIRQGLVELEKFRITKSLRSGYKKPQQIAHAVLARRMGERDPGNRPRPGDRMEFAYVQTPKPGKGVKQLQGERIEDIAHIVDHRLQLDFDKYVEMIEKGLVKLLIHVLPEIPAFDPAVFAASLNPFREKLQDDEKIEKKRLQLLEKEVQRLIFKA
jgi:DNA polymerase delta subunit 1